MPRRCTDTANQHGFTLFETMIVITIVGLLTIVGAPTFIENMRTQQLKGAIQNTYFLLKTARIMSVNLNKNISVQYKATDNWCIALSDADACDCNLKSSCMVQNQTYLLERKDFPDVSLESLVMGKQDTIMFDRHRGISVGKGGSGEFVTSSVTAKFIVSNLGRVRICLPKGKISGYPRC